MSAPDSPEGIDNSLPPIEPNADMRQGAIALRAMYLSYMEVGFTSQETLYLLGVMMAASMNSNGGTPQ